MVSDLNYNGIPAIAEPRNMVNSPENPRLIQFHINHNSNVFRVHARSFARFHCFSRPCVSFRTSSILIAPIRVLASMRALSCSARPRFGAVTCVSHVLRCARARVVPFAA